MNEESLQTTDLMGLAKKLNSYSGMFYGIGFIITMVGLIASTAEVLARYVLPATLPSWMWALEAIIFIVSIVGIIFGGLIIKNFRSVSNYDTLRTKFFTSLIPTYSIIILLLSIFSIIYAHNTGGSLLEPITGIVGVVLLFIGFNTYRGKLIETKLVGGILMLVSIVLIYFVFRTGFTTLLVMWGIPRSGPLLSELYLEATALILGIITTILFAFPELRNLKVRMGEKERKEGIGSLIFKILLSIAIILFACGLMYLNFSSLQPYIDGISTLGTISIVLVGALFLAFSGIAIVVGGALLLATSIKNIVTEVSPAPTTETKPSKVKAQGKFCEKCGAKMSLDAVFCPKCGKKQSANP